MCTRNVVQFYYNITRISVVISNAIRYQFGALKNSFDFGYWKFRLEKKKKWILEWNFLFLVCWWPFLVVLSLVKLILLVFLSALQQLLLFLLLRARLIVSQVTSWCKWRCPWWHSICLFLANFELQFLWFEICVSKLKKCHLLETLVSFISIYLNPNFFFRFFSSWWNYFYFETTNFVFQFELMQLRIRETIFKIQFLNWKLFSNYKIEL